MRPFTPLLRPLLITIFMIVVIIDFIVLPLAYAFNGLRPYTAYTTVEFWASYGAICVSWIISRTKEKLSKTET